MVILLAADRLLTPEEVLQPGWIELTAGTITAIGSGPPRREPDWRATTLVPGLVDTHVHGGGCADHASAYMPSSVRALVACAKPTPRR